MWLLYFGYDDAAQRTIKHIQQYMRHLPNWAYNGGAVACLNDEDVVKLLVEELLPAAVPGFKGAVAVDSYVQRYPVRRCRLTSG